MKKLNFETITAGLSTLQDALDQNAVIGWDELVLERYAKVNQEIKEKGKAQD